MADLYSGVKSAFDYLLNDIYTAIPAIVVRVDNQGEGRLTVKPSLNMRSEQADFIMERSAVLNVPCYYPSGSRGGMTFPVAVGDSCLLVFSMRGLDRWKNGDGYPATPDTPRVFDLKDCIAYVGANPFSRSPNSPSNRGLAHSPEDVVLFHNTKTGGEVEVRLKSGGGIEINAPNHFVNVNCKTSTVNAEDSFEVNTDSFTVNSSSFTVNSGSADFSTGSFNIGTGSYSMTAGDGGATSVGTMRWTGDIFLNGKSVDNHSHGGVISGTERTDRFKE